MYWTLYIFEDDGVWAPVFGDYDRETVMEERKDAQDQGYRTRIERVGPHQSDIDERAARMNAFAHLER